MRRKHTPSPAMAVAFVALIAALAGTAVALPGKGSVDSKDLKKGAVTKKAIAKGAVTSKAIKKNAVSGKAIKDGSVAEGDLADGAVSSNKIANGAVTGQKVDGILPAAVAYVNDDQQIVASNSQGTGTATATLDGSFVCFSGLPFTPKSYQVTTARGGGTAESQFPNAFEPGDNTFCDGSEQASVQFIDDDGSVDNTPPGFYITFYK